jgi:hypothetical protein
MRFLIILLISVLYLGQGCVASYSIRLRGFGMDYYVTLLYE